MKFIGGAAFMLVIGSRVPVSACTPPGSTSEQAINSEAVASVEAGIEESAALFALGKYEEAVVTLSQTLSVSEGRLGEGPYTALVLTNLGLNQASSGRIVEAEESYLHALAINDHLRSSSINRDVKSELTLLNNLGLLYLNTARPEQAQRYILSARALIQSTGMSDDPQTNMTEDLVRRLERAG